MSNQIVNAASMVIEYGTEDLSKVQVPRVPEAVPQHLPKLFLFAQKGDDQPQLVSGVELINTFGPETFNLRGKFANHSTVFAQQMNAQGNALMIKRLFPEDMGPKATMVVWLDVLPTTIDLYKRNSDGSIKIDTLGDPVIDGTAPGFKVKWVVTNYATKQEAQSFGQLTVKPGDQVDGEVQSQRYPMFELEVASYGDLGNMSGIRLWAPTTKSVPSMPSKMMSQAKAYPYFISIINRPDVQTSPKAVGSVFGEQKLMITLKPNVIDPLTDKQLAIGDSLIQSYQNLTDLRYAKMYGDFGRLNVYQDNVDLLSGMFHAAETPHIDQYSDFGPDVSEKYLFNLVSGVTSSNTPYHTFVFADSQNTVRFSEYTNIFAGGGSDGTMNDEIFADLVIKEMAAYLDPNDPVQEQAVNVESIMHDSGLPLAAKYALINFIGIRRDTFVHLSTYTVGGPEMSASEEISIAIALRTRLQMFPESDYFGTPVMRGMITGRSGTLRNSQYAQKLPLTLEIAIKSAKYMGAGNGRWKNGEHFDGAPGSVIDYMSDISITWVPTSVRNRNWDVGLNWVQAFDRRSYFFPALKTIYDNDTSVLNSYFTALAIGQLNKVQNAVWREFSGVSNLTNAQLADRANASFTAKVTGRFDERFIIVPDAQFTDMDLARGFSWTMPVKIYAPSMKTVMTSYIQAYRKDDLAAA